MIGDTPLDIRCARAIGAKMLAVATGGHALSELKLHRPDFAVSAPEVFLAAAAARTSRIRLGSAVTVLSSDDPIRVFQRFSTLDAVSSARTRIERVFDPDMVRRMKDLADRDITVGGPDLAGQAIRAGLVDECHLFVSPIVVGAGKLFWPMVRK